MSKKRSINDINKSTMNKKGFEEPAQIASPSANGEAAQYARNAAAYHEMAKSAKGGKTALWVILAVLLAILIGSGTAFGLYMADISNRINVGNKSDDELAAISDALGGYSSNFDEPFYMLLLGTDARGDEEFCRTDTNVVVRVDAQNDIVTMVSIPRDTKIELEGEGTQKFNSAYAFQKVPGVIKATEDLLDIKISHYAEVNFLELKGLVDAVGGVTVTNEEVIDNPKCDDGDGNHYVIPEGEVTLNGGEALTFARNRDYVNGDFQRTAHQRALIEAIVDEVLHTPLTDIPGVIQAASDCITTDISIPDIIGLAQAFADADDIVMYDAMLPSYTQNINGISFVINDEEKTEEMMELVEAGEDPSGIVSTKTAPDINDSKVDTSNTLTTKDDAVYSYSSSSTSSGGYASSGSYGNSGSYGSSSSTSSGTGTGSTGTGTGTGSGTGTGTGTTGSTGTGSGGYSNGYAGASTGGSTSG